MCILITNNKPTNDFSLIIINKTKERNNKKKIFFKVKVLHTNKVIQKNNILKMDYSTLRNIKAELKTPQEHVADGIDLSNNYANDNDQRKFYSKYLNNHKINNNCASDCDDDQKNVTDLAKETKIKLNFSVDRILGNNHGDYLSDGCSNEKSVDRSTLFGDKFNQNCLDCSTVTNVPPSVNSPYFSVPFSMAALLNLNKSIVRPMPVRYMTRPPTGNFNFIFGVRKFENVSIGN